MKRTICLLINIYTQQCNCMPILENVYLSLSCVSYKLITMTQFYLQYVLSEQYKHVFRLNHNLLGQ